MLFGKDAYAEELAGATEPLANWEEKTWLGSRTSRDALATALTGMMKDGQVTRREAVDGTNRWDAGIPRPSQV